MTSNDLLQRISGINMFAARKSSLDPGCKDCNNILESRLKSFSFHFWPPVGDVTLFKMATPVRDYARKLKQSN